MAKKLLDWMVVLVTSSCKLRWRKGMSKARFLFFSASAELFLHGHFHMYSYDDDPEEHSYYSLLLGLKETTYYDVERWSSRWVLQYDRQYYCFLPAPP